MKKIIFVILGVILLASCVKVYIPECPEDERKKVEVAFNINTEMEVENFTRAAILDTTPPAIVNYFIYEVTSTGKVPLEEGTHDRATPLVIKAPAGNYSATFVAIDPYPTGNILPLATVNSTNMNHVYSTSVDFTVDDVNISETVELTRKVSAIRFVRSDKANSKFIELTGVKITSSTQWDAVNNTLSNKAGWDGSVNPTDRNGQIWNYVFPESVDFVVSFYAKNGQKEFTLTKTGVVIAPNKKYTVIISRNNTDNAMDVGYTIDIKTGWEDDEDLI